VASVPVGLNVVARTARWAVGSIATNHSAAAMPYCLPMRVNWKAATAALGLSVFLPACSPPIPTNGVSYEQFRFTCCVNSGALLRSWHPGQDITVQWMTASAGMTSDDTQHPITLSALLTGPYASVAALKAGGTHSAALLASPLHVTDRTPGNPASTIALPLDLAAGWYNLATTIQSAGGIVSGATVIQVTRVSS
jgi:hypothetical protein